jgi:hypothetical protein
MSDQNLKKSLLGWLETSGFALEMRAAAAFRRAGFQVRQACHYYDRAEGTDRELDVFATYGQLYSEGAIYFTVECKSSSKPWVILVSEDTLAGIETSHVWGVPTHETTAACQAVESRLSQLPWSPTSSECGYALRKAHVNQRDDGFAASVVACKAAQYFVLGLQADQRTLPRFSIGVPIIVVDSPLFEARLGSTHEIELISVATSIFLFESHDVWDSWSCIRVVHIDALPEWTVSMARETHQMSAFLRELDVREGDT